jgi:hypothetical protein
VLIEKFERKYRGKAFGDLWRSLFLDGSFIDPLRTLRYFFPALGGTAWGIGISEGP